MPRRLLIPLVAALTFLLADVRTTDAWVILSVLPKGEVPEQQFPESITGPLKKVLPMRGDAVDGFPHYSCTLYYRGTHENVQELLNDLGKVNNVAMSVRFDRTGKVGKLESRKAFPLTRPLTYLYQVFLTRNDRIDLGFEQTKAQINITVTVYAAGGIDPDKLKLPKHFNKLNVITTSGPNVL